MIKKSITRNPKIIFKYSETYDQVLQKCFEFYKFYKVHKQNANRKELKLKKWVSSGKILNNMEKMKKFWKKDERKILEEISKITKLKWREKQIYCYMTGRENYFAFSDPLTLPFYKKLDFLTDILVHELIHKILQDDKVNWQEFLKTWKYIERKYKNETGRTKIHIIVHAIHSHIYFKFYSEKRLKRNINSPFISAEEKRAWKIVQKENYKNIIKVLNN